MHLDYDRLTVSTDEVELGNVIRCPQRESERACEQLIGRPSQERFSRRVRKVDPSIIIDYENPVDRPHYGIVKAVPVFGMLKAGDVGSSGCHFFPDVLRGMSGLSFRVPEGRALGNR